MCVILTLGTVSYIVDVPISINCLHKSVIHFSISLSYLAHCAPSSLPVLRLVSFFCFVYSLSFRRQLR